MARNKLKAKEASTPVKSPSVLWIFALLAFLSLTAFGRSLSYSRYINLDTEDYVTKNSHVRAGVSLEEIRWAFTTFDTGDWQPLTWISWMALDQPFGMAPSVSRAFNLSFHILTTFLLFIVLRRMTGDFWKPAFTAALFSIHPMRVESVVWVAERKDVLSGVFFMLALLAYEKYARRPSLKAMSLTVLAMAGGLMAKPVLVTLPFLLLLLDYWPLRRFETSRFSALAAEKIPLFILSAFSCVTAYIAGRSAGGMYTFDEIPLKLRLINAVICYFRYVKKTLWPYPLAHFYPHPMGDYSQAKLAAGFLTLAIIFYAVWRFRKDKPFITVGLLWFLGVLFPVMGWVQVGSAAMADRYTYLPHIGFFIAAVWLWPVKPSSRAAAVFSLLLLSILSFQQTGYWRSSIALNRHALETTRSNRKAKENLKYSLIKRGDVRKVFEFYADKAGVEIPEIVVPEGAYQGRNPLKYDSEKSYEQKESDNKVPGALDNAGGVS